MIKLTQWYLSEHKKSDTKEIFYQAHGYVIGHPKLLDGIHINTSRVEKIEFDSLNNRVLMKTYSKNEYEMFLSDICFNSFKKTKGILKKLNVSIPSFDKCKKLSEKAELDLLHKVEELLKENELYLQAFGVYIQKAFWKCQTKEIREIKVLEHSGMFQDSYLITDWDKHEVDFRYFDKFNVIEPYHWSDGLDAVLIDNKGSVDIWFAGTDKRILCKAGEVTRIESKEYRGEGLFSPDVVTGKCALTSGGWIE